jgi:Cu+-exporting ATPase
MQQVVSRDEELGAIPAHDHEEEQDHEHGHLEPFELIRIAVTAAVAAAVWFRVWEPFAHVSVLGIAGVLFGGYPIF